MRKDPEGLVLGDLTGPGVVYRLWTPTPTDDVLEFLFDGEPKPRMEVKFRDLFLGTHPEFPRPLVHFLSLSSTGDDRFGPHFLSPTCDVPDAAATRSSLRP